ncbi:unnamed protein product, partial [Mycena citricolor]
TISLRSPFYSAPLLQLLFQSSGARHWRFRDFTCRIHCEEEAAKCHYRLSCPLLFGNLLVHPRAQRNRWSIQQARFL